MKKIVLCICACALSVVNLMFGVKTPQSASDLTLQNIEIVGLSAGETVCEGTNDADCYLYNSNGVLVGKSKGPLINYN